MKYYIQLLALISIILSLAIGSYTSARDTYSVWSLQRVSEKQLVSLQETLRDLRVRAEQPELKLKKEGEKQQKTFLRDTLFDFNLMLKQLPAEMEVSNIIYDTPIVGDVSSAAEYNEVGIPFVSLSLILRYREYLVAVAVFLEWFAYSSLPIVVEEFTLKDGYMEMNIKVYGLLE